MGRQKNQINVEMAGKLVASVCGPKRKVKGGDAGASSRLWHGEHVDNPDGVVIHKITQHEAHDLHRDASAACEGEGTRDEEGPSGAGWDGGRLLPRKRYFSRLAVLEHLQEGKRRDLDVLGGVHDLGIGAYKNRQW